MRRVLPLLLVVLLVAALIAPLGAQERYPADVEAWLREAQMGPHAPAAVNWDMIYQAARRTPMPPSWRSGTSSATSRAARG